MSVPIPSCEQATELLKRLFPTLSDTQPRTGMSGVEVIYDQRRGNLIFKTPTKFQVFRLAEYLSQQRMLDVMAQQLAGIE